MSTSGGAGSVPIAIPVITTGPTASVNRPDPEKVQEAESFLQSETQEQAVRDLQQNRTFTVTAALISRLRAQLREQRRADGERRFSDQEVQLAVTRYFNPDSNPMDGLRDPSTGRLNPDLQAALRGEDPASQQQPNGEGQQQQQGLGGDAYRRMVRGQQVPTNQTAVPTPRTPQPPPQQVVATYTPPPPPVPNAPLARTAGAVEQPLAEGVSQPDTPVLAGEEAGADGQPLIPRQPGPSDRSGLARGPLRKAGQLTYFAYTPNDGGRGTALPIDQRQAAENLAAQSRLLLSGGQPQTPPPPQGTVVPRDTFQSILREGDSALARSDSDSSDRDRSLGLGYGRGGASAIIRRGANRDRFGGGTGGYC